MRARHGRSAIWLGSLLAVVSGCSRHGTPAPVAGSTSAVEIDADELAPAPAEPLRPERIERRLSLGGSFGCLRDAEGGLGCWGSHVDLEQLEAGLAGVEPPVVALHSRFGGEGCVVIEGGRVRCWNHDYEEEEPPWIVEGLDDAIALCERCALRATGEVACGIGSGPGRAVPEELTNVLEVVGGGWGETKCMRTSEGLGGARTTSNALSSGLGRTARRPTAM